MERQEKLREVERLLSRARVLEAELAREIITADAPPRGYPAYNVVSGCIFGVFGAAVSLLLNVVGSLLFHQHPLHLIRVYLTFPLGSDAMQVSNDLALAIGCCLYLATGMLLGIPFQLMLSRWFANDSFRTRFVATTILAILLWLVNFYGILSWLQPLLFGGNWIVSEIPWWVAALTHLVFGWTILLASPLGRYSPYRRIREIA